MTLINKLKRKIRKNLYTLIGVSGLILGVKPDDSLGLYTKLKQMASKQIHDYKSGTTTYKTGVDFQTNQPVYRLMNSKSCEQRDLKIALDLSEKLNSYPKI